MAFLSAAAGSTAPAVPPPDPDSDPGVQTAAHTLPRAGARSFSRMPTESPANTSTAFAIPSCLGETLHRHIAPGPSSAPPLHQGNSVVSSFPLRLLPKRRRFVRAPAPNRFLRAPTLAQIFLTLFRSESA